MTTPSTPIAATSFTVATFDEVRAAAELLAAHGRRAEALTLVSEALDALNDGRLTLLLAELHLDSHTREGALRAEGLLGYWRCTRPADVEGVALERRALCELNKRRAVAKLDRDTAWISTSAYRRWPIRRSS